MKEFFLKNKVLIIGLLSAIALPIYDLLNKGETSVKVLVMSGAVALTSYLARNLRGQLATIATAIGTMIATYMAQDQTGQVSWAQIFLQGILLVLGATAPPPKSQGYEKTDLIIEAKKEGEAIAPSAAKAGVQFEKPAAPKDGSL